jgi:hypothetical protein
VKNRHFGVTLTGPGPTYADPQLTVNSNTQYRQLGKITVDRSNRKVTIDLKEVVSKAGERLRMEPNPANGTYDIKQVTSEEFFPDALRRCCKSMPCGDHSDNGHGHGYETNDLSFAPLYYIWSEGMAANVPFGPLPAFQFTGDRTPHDLSATFPYSLFPKRPR